MEKEKYLKIIDILADRIYTMDLKLSVLKHANERMERQIKELEAKLEATYPLEEVNNEI